MSVHEAMVTAGAILAVVGSLAGAGLLGLQTVAWVWYRRDGGKLGLLEWLRGI